MLQIHVILSLVGILTGFVVLYGLVTGVSSSGWTAIFLATTILTSVTGFPLPPFGFGPPRAGRGDLARPAGAGSRRTLRLPTRGQPSSLWGWSRR